MATLARRIARCLALTACIVLVISLLALARPASAASNTADSDATVSRGGSTADEAAQLPDIPPPSTTTSASSAASSTPAEPEKPKVEIQLLRHDFCVGCYSVVEEFHKYTVRNFNDPSRRRNQTMTRNELVEWFCRSPPFSEFKEPIVHGCIKATQDHHDRVLAPFIGTHTSFEYTTLANVFKHRVEACAAIDACDPWVPETRAKNDCEACTRLVGDVYWSLSREAKVNATIVERMQRTVCMEVGMRHEKPMEVEAFCHEYVDEHWKAMQAMLVKVFNDPNIPSHAKQQAIKKRFCGGMTEVCEVEREEMRAEIAQRKAEEKAARLAAREKRKTGAAEQPQQTQEEKSKDEL